MPTGTLFLIPTTLGKTESNNTIPEEVLRVIRSLDVLYVENIQSAVKFLQWVGDTKPEYQIDFYSLNKKTTAEEAHSYLEPLQKGKNAGILSEAGCPGVADPGNLLVKMAHNRGIKVQPLVGPSSILLALMASGFNGQQFAFHGYLPIDKKEREHKIRLLEKESREKDQTQIFMETPHRNNEMVKSILNAAHPESKLCIATDITLASESIQTFSIEQWKSVSKPDLQKRPTIFILYWK